jgi:hypothetical protein
LTAVADYLARSDLTSFIPNFVQNFEEDFIREPANWGPDIEAALSVTITSNVAAVPSDYLGLKIAYIDGQRSPPLKRISLMQLYERTGRMDCTECREFRIRPDPLRRNAQGHLLRKAGRPANHGQFPRDRSARHRALRLTSRGRAVHQERCTYPGVARVVRAGHDLVPKSVQGGRLLGRCPAYGGGVSTDATIWFKEWLPDLPPFENPGLVLAQNVIPANRTYKSAPEITSLAGAPAALSSRPRGTFPYTQTEATTGAQVYGLLVGTADDLYRISTNGLTFNSIRAATYNGGTNGSSSYWRFAQFDNVLLATNSADLPQQYTLGATAASTLGSSTGTAPAAQQVGVINRFVMLGDLPGTANGAHAVRWSGIDDPDSWPTPLSATAVAQQSGIQYLPVTAGTVTAISGGDQHGIIFQRAGVNRATYVGPPVVFQFDVLDSARGCYFPNSMVRVGAVIYFASALGFLATDGVSVVPIGDGKVDKYFVENVDFTRPQDVYGAVDYEIKCVMWALRASGQVGVTTRILYYNYEEKRWSVQLSSVQVLTSGIQRG